MKFCSNKHQQIVFDDDDPENLDKCPLCLAAERYEQFIFSVGKINAEVLKQAKNEIDHGKKQ